LVDAFKFVHNKIPCLCRLWFHPQSARAALPSRTPRWLDARHIRPRFPLRRPKTGLVLGRGGYVAFQGNEGRDVIVGFGDIRGNDGDRDVVRVSANGENVTLFELGRNDVLFIHDSGLNTG